ncbi:MAG: hypothetical protein K6F46_09270 [Desulfovibrio sp.]|nr:hypothetical protein [Desulfovibrio sp.]
MASCTPFSEEENFAEKIRSLDDEDLLDVWTESQKVLSLLNATTNLAMCLSTDYEGIIVSEMTRRAKGGTYPCLTAPIGRGLLS